MIEKRTTMTLEEAKKLEGDWLPKQEYLKPSETPESSKIDIALRNWNYMIDSYHGGKEGAENMLIHFLEEDKEYRYDQVIIRYETLEEYVTRRSSGYPKFTAWSDKYVYVIGCYDGHYWIQKISRHPSDFIIEPIGGG